MTMLPTMSAGIRSGVNWMREYLSCKARGQSAQKRSLAEARHAFQEHMAAGQHADEDAVDDVLLAHDYLGDLGPDVVQARHCILQSSFRVHGFIVER